MTEIFRIFLNRSTGLMLQEIPEQAEADWGYILQTL